VNRLSRTRFIRKARIARKSDHSLTTGHPFRRDGQGASVSSKETIRAVMAPRSAKGPEPTLIARNGLTIITKSLGRVGKKAQPDDIDGFIQKIMANIETTTDA